MTLFSDPPRPLLTVEDVEQWKAAAVRLRAELADVERKLAAAAVFMPEALELPKGGFVEALTKARAKVASLNEEILRVVDEASGPMTPKMIRETILAGPHPEVIGSENYLYTAIKRLADRHELEREGDGYVRQSL